MLIHVYVPSERVNRFLVSGNEVWLNILGEIGQIHFFVSSGHQRVPCIIINDTKCKYTFNFAINFAKINSACKAGKFVQVGCIIMCTCISNGMMAYQYFSSKSRWWNKTLRKTFHFFIYFFREIDSPIHCYMLYPSAHTSPIQWISPHLKFAVWALTLQWPNRT